MEQLTRARHMDSYSTHIIICPRLMAYNWRKSLSKRADTIFYIEPGSRDFWPSNMHEPLTIGLILPFSLKFPWQLRRSEKNWNWNRNCQQCGKRKEGMNALFCANFGHKIGALTVSDSVWCGKFYSSFEDDKFHINLSQDASVFERVSKGDGLCFEYARDEDQFKCPFQCGDCIFWILNRRIPNNLNPRDSSLLRCIRQVNLDAMWAREPGTVNDNRRDI